MRLKEIDFLRFLAIFLVLFRHQEAEALKPLHFIGWTGVDLFFVLSGFLVSELLFKEYHKTGSIKTGQFLIRRGFKIYPLYYTLLVAYMVTVLVKYYYAHPETGLEGYTPDFMWKQLIFMQNYLGINIWATWTLAVEEHFYLMLTFFLWLLTFTQFGFKPWFFIPSILAAMLVILLLRLRGNIYYCSCQPFHHFYTHKRIDAMFAGVLLSYVKYFYPEALQYYFNKLKYILLAVMVGCFTFLATTDLFTPAMMGYGFTLVYVAYVILLAFFLLEPTIKILFKQGPLQPVLSGLAYIGLFSYGIYIFHMVIVDFDIVPENAILKSIFARTEVWAVAVYIIASIIGGIFTTKLIEIPALHVRERLFPKKF
jgi:peptidoglycan/LPS O-acetylase OafA/YrhL